MSTRDPGQETWRKIVQAIEFFAARRSWAHYRPVGLLGVVSDFSGSNEFMSFEVLNLLVARPWCTCSPTRGTPSRHT